MQIPGGSMFQAGLIYIAVNWVKFCSDILDILVYLWGYTSLEELVQKRKGGKEELIPKLHGARNPPGRI